tara:strand:- start:1323 stop:1964 length:642 start_codon:yes stop_codon:yes gene_type:complete
MKSILSKIYIQILYFFLPKIYNFFDYYYDDFKKKYHISSEIIKLGKNKKYNKKELQNKVKNTRFFQLWHIKNQLKNFNTSKYKYIDIGSGWGTTLIFFNHYFDFKQVIGVENHKETANSSDKIIKLNNLKKIKIINKNGKKFKWDGYSIIYLNLASKSLVDSILKFNKKNIQNKKNIIIIYGLDQFNYYKNLKLFKNYKYKNYPLLRYFMFFN